MPFTTAGEEKSTKSPICPCHARVRLVALFLLIVFSSALKPRCVGESLNEVQSVRTRNLVEAVRPLVFPVACTAWDPGCADFATVTPKLKLPELSAVAWPRVAVSKVSVTLSPEEKPEPVAVVRVVGGPRFGESETDAVAAKAGGRQNLENDNCGKRPRKIRSNGNHERPSWLDAAPVLSFIADDKGGDCRTIVKK